MTLDYSGGDEILESRTVSSDDLETELQAIADLVQSVAHRHSGDAIALLALLRILEASHREICDGLFHEALPESRQYLYSFLKDMESEGGWPYIPRMKLRALLRSFAPDLQSELDKPTSQSDRPTP